MMLAAQLPESPAEARAVLDFISELVDGFLDRKGAPAPIPAPAPARAAARGEGVLPFARLDASRLP